jgi:acyl carrier protein
MEQLFVEDHEVTMEATFDNDLGTDSLDNIELIMAFEEEISIEIPDCDIIAGKTVKDAVEFIDKAVKG